MKFLHVLPVLVVLSPAAFAGQVSIVAARDNALYSESPAHSNGAGSHLFAGNNAQSHVRRALLRFDIAASVPPQSTITSVKLVLHVSQGNVGAITHTLHRVLADWGESTSDAPGSEGSGAPAAAGDATWSERFFGAAEPWATPGGEFDAQPCASVVVDAAGTYELASSAAFVAQAQHMLDAPAANFGWILRGGESAPSTSKRFDSREHADPSVHPRLVVDFTPPCPQPSTYCTAAPNSAGAGGAQIGSSGTVSVSANAFTLTARGLPLGADGLFHCGPAQAAVPFGNGVRCVGGRLRRLGAGTAVAGSVQRALDFTSAPASVVTAGSTWNFQLWYRDPAGGGAGFNLSDALSVSFCP